MCRTQWIGALCGAALLVSSPLAGLQVFAQDAGSKEYFVKAAFLYNFVKFIEWPGNLAVSKISNLNICVVGDNPFDGATAVFKEASTDKLKLSVLEYRDWKGVPDNCHMLFISRSESGRINEIFNALQQKPVLSVSDIDHFAEKGGIIGFVLSNNKIKLVVNKKAAETAGLRVDAQLLEIALNVIDR